MDSRSCFSTGDLSISDPWGCVPSQRYGEARLHCEQTLTFNIDELSVKIYKRVFFQRVHMGPVQLVAGRGGGGHGVGGARGVVKQTVAEGARQSLPEGLPQCKHFSVTLSF